MVYDIAANNGLEGYLRNVLKVEEGQTVGDWALQKLQEVVSRLDGFTGDLDLSILGQYTVAVNRAQTGTELKPEFDLTMQKVDAEGQSEGDPDTGKVKVDLSYIATAANEFVQKVQAKLNEGDWQSNNYGSAPLLDDLNKLVQKGLMPAFEKQLDDEDPDSTALNLMNHAWQAFADGDEANKLDAGQLQHERELLTGDTLKENLSKKLWGELVYTNTD